MSKPTTPTGRRHHDRVKLVGYAWLATADIIAIEQEAAAAERERLVGQGWHEPRFDCGPIKAQPHEHAYVWTSTGSTNDPPPTGCPCIGCGHLYGDPESPTDE